MTTNETTPAEPTTQLVFSDSSNLKAARLDLATSVLEVEFKSGSKYSYGQFTPELMKQWQEAKSAGSWFDANVKKKVDKHPVVGKAEASPPPATATPVPPAAAATTPVALAVDATKCDPETLREAQHLYLAYVANSNGLAWDGRPCPAWKDLGTAVQSHWCAAALKAKERSLHYSDRQALVIDNEELKKKLQQSQGYSKHSLDTAVLERTKTIEEDCSKLRARVAELEGIVKTNDFRPWRAKS